MSKRAVALVLANDKPARAREFAKACAWFSQRFDGDVDVYELFRGQDMITPARNYGRAQSVDQLAVFAHGTPVAFGRPGRFGVDTRVARQRRDGVMGPELFAQTWGAILAPGALVSLACCLCSRDPKWYRVQLAGKDWSSWGPRAYQDGGQKGVAAVLARAFGAVGRNVVVRGHCAAGHTIYQALLREHRFGLDAAMGRALFGMTLPGVEPDRERRNAWQKAVKGEVAASWLLGLLSTEQTVNRILDSL